MTRGLFGPILLAPLLVLSAVVAAQDRSVLPIGSPAFDGVLQPSVEQSRTGTFARTVAPAGAPNVLLFMSDDVGFGMAGTFGGPVPTPNFDRLARHGVRYNRFHTTGICSPTRAALLTGRNHHNAGFGYLADLPADYPGYRAEFPRSVASLPEVLRLNGYNTAMFGKWHNTRAEFVSTAGPFDQWPAGQGFEFFYGLIGGDTDQFRPALYRNTVRLDDLPEGSDLLDKRLADELIGWVHQQQATAPDKPFFVYLAPNSTHAPHQAPADYIARFRGQFDQGWDRMREESHARMLAQGLVPRGTVLTPRPPEIPAWNSLSPRMKAWHARGMEVAAGMLAYQDEQLGRVLDELERTGEADNLLTIAILGDNGASAESGVDGTLIEIAKINGARESEAVLHNAIPELGGPHHYPAYGAGWAWAMNTPLRWTKQYASMLGGIRNGMILQWNHAASPQGSICSQFGHVVDVAPTVLDAAGIPAPRYVFGVDQKPLDGISLLPSMIACRPAAPRTQYFEMGGKIGLWHNGWFASLDDGRVPWSTAPTANEGVWELYDLTHDFSQSRNVAARFPERLHEMIGLFDRQARANNVYPLMHGFGAGRARPASDPRSRYDFFGMISQPATANPVLMGRSFILETSFVGGGAGRSGPVIAYGSRFGGWSLYLDHGRPVFHYAISGQASEIFVFRADRALSPTENLRLEYLGQGIRRPASIRIFAGAELIAQGELPNTFLSPAGLGETFDIGQDRGVRVTTYPEGAEQFDGTIDHVVLNFLPTGQQLQTEGIHH